MGNQQGTENMVGQISLCALFAGFCAQDGDLAC